MLKNIIRNSNEQGFTLIETVVAILILTIGLLALAQLFVLATYTNTFAYSESVELKAAEDTMEMLRSKLFSDPLLSIGGTINNTPDACATGCAADQNHVQGVYFQPLNSSGQPAAPGDVIISYAQTMASYSTDPASNWNKRQYEVRWQVIGYPSTPPAPGAAAPQYMTFNAYADDFPANPNVASPPNYPLPIYPLTPPDLTGQTALLVIVRVIPVGAKGAARLAKRVQIATTFCRP